jgi:MFS family permease
MICTSLLNFARALPGSFFPGRFAQIFFQAALPGSIFAQICLTCFARPAWQRLRLEHLVRAEQCPAMTEVLSSLRSPWRAVAAMFLLNGALFGIWASRIPAVAERHALGAADLGGLLLLMAAGALVSFPLSGRMSDRVGAYRVMWVFAIAYVGALGLIALAPSYLALAAALLFFGATHGGMDVSMNAWASEVERHLARPAMSSFHAMFSLGAGLGAGSGYLAASAGVPLGLHFCVAGASFAVLCFTFGKIAWRSKTRLVETRAPIFLIPRGPLFLVGFVAFCASIGEGGMADWSAIFLVLTTAATEAEAALGYAVFSAAMVVMRFMGDRATRMFGPVMTAQIAGGLATAGVLCAVVLGTYGFALLGFALMGLGYAVIVPLAFSRAANDAVLQPGAAIASVSTLGYGGMLVGPPVIGFIAELTSIRVAFGLLAVLAVMIVVFASSLTNALTNALTNTQATQASDKGS